MTETSERLVRDLTSGDPRAADRLLAMHLPALRAFVRVRAGPAIRAREAVSDVVQSVAREVLEGAGRLEYRGEGAFRSWLFRTALRKLIEKDRHHRAKRRDFARSLPLAPDSRALRERELSMVYGSLGTPSRDAMRREEIDRLEAAFDALPEAHREAVVMHHFVGLTHAEIAEEMNRSVGAVRNLVYRGLARLAERMVDEA